jgi:hypothetical protein
MMCSLPATSASQQAPLEVLAASTGVWGASTSTIAAAAIPTEAVSAGKSSIAVQKLASVTPGGDAKQNGPDAGTSVPATALAGQGARPGNPTGGGDPRPGSSASDDTPVRQLVVGLEQVGQPGNASDGKAATTSDDELRSLVRQVCAAHATKRGLEVMWRRSLCLRFERVWSCLVVRWPRS